MSKTRDLPERFADCTSRCLVNTVVLLSGDALVLQAPVNSVQPGNWGMPETRGTRPHDG